MHFHGLNLYKSDAIVRRKSGRGKRVMWIVHNHAAVSCTLSPHQRFMLYYVKFVAFFSGTIPERDLSNPAKRCGGSKHAYIVPILFHYRFSMHLIMYCELLLCTTSIASVLKVSIIFLFFRFPGYEIRIWSFSRMATMSSPQIRELRYARSHKHIHSSHIRQLLLWVKVFLAIFKT